MSAAEYSPAEKTIEFWLQKIGATRLTPLDILPRAELAEKLIELNLSGLPPGIEQGIAAALLNLASALARIETEGLKVVVFGGGTGLSNAIGGDSKSPAWLRAPFGGLKSVFPQTRAVVCITDDGGSTGELLKDLPLVALGDIRRVLLSSIQKRLLRKKYNLNELESGLTATVLYYLFNHRFTAKPASSEALLAETGLDLTVLPESMRVVLQRLISFLFMDERLVRLLARPHCLGNLLLAAAIYLQMDNIIQTSASETPEPPPDSECSQTLPAAVLHSATLKGLMFLAELIGANPEAAMPCTTTPARLQMLYGNGPLVTGEYKSASTRRQSHIERVFVEFVEQPLVPEEVMHSIKKADVIILAPGSLFSSTIPILQVPGLANEIRRNKQALKILVSNLWVQKGETDVVRDDPKRRFYVSDLILAYHRNIPGGVRDLFHHVLTLGLRDIPGSILQSYALEDKVPIYLDRKRVREMGFAPIEAGIFSQTALQERRIIQHDPDALAKAIRTLWAIRKHLSTKVLAEAEETLPPPSGKTCPVIKPDHQLPNQRFAALANRLEQISITPNGKTVEIRKVLLDILWRHSDIPLNHLDNVSSLVFITPALWGRSQQWDNIFSFYDPADGGIKIRADILEDKVRFEIAFLVALGESLLGDYAADKKVYSLDEENVKLGRVFQLTMREVPERHSYLGEAELDHYLQLARMIRSDLNKLRYTRIINGNEGFTPPGLLFGLIYSWYLDNRLSTHIEYKMAIMNHEVSDLIPEQVKIHSRRRSLVDFFRRDVFHYHSAVYEEDNAN